MINVNKKGQGSLIAWVLLIGFAVSLAVFVGRWWLEQAGESTEQFEEMLMGDVKCADVAISGSCKTGKVTNRGVLKIDRIRIMKDGTTSMCKGPLMPNSEISCSIAGSKVKLMPILDFDHKTVGCNNKEITLNCEVAA